MPDDPDDGLDGTERPSGAELARQALAQAKADARRRGAAPGTPRGRRGAGRSEPGRGGDPQLFGGAIRDLLAVRGWEERVAVGGVFGRWPRIVGAELAEHTAPQTFTDGVLVVAADSSTWAAQLRLLAAVLVKRLNEDLGQGTVRRVAVVGPASASRRRGGLRAGGRPPDSG